MITSPPWDTYQVNASMTTTTVPSTANVVIPGSEKRYSLTIFGGSGDGIHISTLRNVTTSTGWDLTKITDMVTLFYDIHGEIVRSPWFGISTAGTGTLTYAEGLVG